MFNVCLAVLASVFERLSHGSNKADVRGVFFGVHVMVTTTLCMWSTSTSNQTDGMLTWYGCFLSFLVETLKNHLGFSPICTQVSLCQEGDSTSIRSRCTERTRKRGTGVGWFGSLVVGGLGRFFSPMCPFFFQETGWWQWNQFGCEDGGLASCWQDMRIEFKRPTVLHFYSTWMFVVFVCVWEMGVSLNLSLVKFHELVYLDIDELLSTCAATLRELNPSIIESVQRGCEVGPSTE